MIKIKRWPVFGNGKFNVISLVINFNKESKKEGHVYLLIYYLIRYELL